jgi:5'-3' exonuclease
MNKNKYALIIDGNYFLFRTLHVLPPPQIKGEILGTQDDVDIYVRKLATDLTYQIRLFGGIIDTVIWTLDSKSWRKDFYPTAEYKGTRKSDESINWDNFTRATDEFKASLAKAGVISSKIQGAEGDDLIYAWNTELNAIGKSNIILTGDRDMIQLVNMDPSSEAHSLFYTPAHNKLYTPPGFMNWVNEKPVIIDDFFQAVRAHGVGRDQMKTAILNAVSIKKLDVIEQDPQEFIFKKMLIGDGGDNVMPAYWWTSTLKNGSTRVMGISDKKADLIYEAFIKKNGPFNYMYLFSQDYITDIANTLIKIMNAKTMSREQIIGNIKMNTNLMLLSSHTIPAEIIEDMFKSIEDRPSSTVDVKRLTSMKELLAGTRYVEDDSSAITSSFFKGNEEAADMSFITDRKSTKTIF